jgi:hypothetical protein
VADLGLSVAAVLCAHAMNVGFKPVTSPGVDALTPMPRSLRVGCDVKLIMLAGLVFGV